MSCTNCFNGCSEINSDQCIKYTGVDVPALGITNGDTLLSIEETIFNYIQSFILGEEIFPTLNPSILCKIINDNLPICSGCTGISLNDILTAIIKSVCDLETEIANINGELDILNADYAIPIGPGPTFTPCLTGVTNSSDTHSILQAVINNLCTLNSAVSALSTNLNSYVLITALDDLITEYLETEPSQQLISNRMVPYTAVPYFPPGGSFANFDGSGAGLGIWDRIFLCNGANPGVPDLRGRVLVTSTSMLGNTITDPAVLPGVNGNPAYALSTTQGANQITLTENQIPSHVHPNTVASVVTEEPHQHDLPGGGSGSGGPSNYNNNTLASGLTTFPASTNLTVVTTIDNKPTGGNLPHSNIQPVFACYYIMYIPAP
jgi:microcystin-dependent protein